MTTELILLRHGETEWNSAGRLQGHLDSALSPEGLRQADLLAARLSSVSFHALYSSDLGRALETARRIATRTGHSILQDWRLRERGLGVFEGLTRDEARVARKPTPAARPKPYEFRFQPTTKEFTISMKFRRSQVSDDELAHALRAALEQVETRMRGAGADAGGGGDVEQPS